MHKTDYMYRKKTELYRKDYMQILKKVDEER